MGRPLNKKYFGNRNVGVAGNQTGVNANSQNYADDRIGGEGVASVVLNALGSYTTRPTVTFPAPSLPTGVTALGTVTSEVLSAAVSGSQTRAYPTAAGAIGFDTQGTTFTATVTSAALTTVARASATTLGFDAANANIAVSGNSIHITGASITGTMTIGGVAIAAGQIYYTGTPSTTTSATLYATYADAVSATNPLTIVAGTGVGGATFTYGVTFGVVTALTPVARGSYEALVASAPAINATYGDGLIIIPTYRAKAVVITEKGSGYTSAPTGGSLTFTQSVTATSTALTTDSGLIGSATNQENAIIIHANTGEGTEIGDIIRQVRTRGYKVRTSAGGVRVCNLVANDTPTVGKAYIIATDSDSNTYYVTKLTAHRVTLIRKTFASLGQWQFESDQSAPWKFFEGQANADVGYVKIENA